MGGSPIYFIRSGWHTTNYALSSNIEITVELLPLGKNPKLLALSCHNVNTPPLRMLLVFLLLELIEPIFSKEFHLNRIDS